MVPALSPIMAWNTKPETTLVVAENKAVKMPSGMTDNIRMRRGPTRSAVTPAMPLPKKYPTLNAVANTPSAATAMPSEWPAGPLTFAHARRST